MNAQEIIAKVSKYKEMLEAESDSDIRARYQKKIKELEASLEEVEKKVEKLEEKVATEEKKELSEAEKKIRKYQDFLDNESDPDLKARYQKKIKELQDSLKEVKEEIKVEKKEVAEQKAEIKKAAKVVKAAKATKVERKEAVKKVEKKVRERKQVSVKRTRRGKKIKEIIDELDKLIAKNKKLKEKYAGKGVDVKRDAGRSAKPFGYRFVGKHDYRVPTADQIKKGKKRGTIDYEGRPNRSDVYPKRTAKLAKGGEVRYVDEFTNNDGIEISTSVSEDGKKFYMAHVTMYPLQRMIPMNEDKDAVVERAKKIHSDMEKHLAEEKMAKGGRVGHSKEDKARFAKPAGWRWKEIAVTKRIIEIRRFFKQRC